MLWIRFAGLTAGGNYGDVVITDFSGISNDLRLNRTDRLGADGQIAGHDYVSKRVWTLTLTTLADDENGSVALASQWEKALLDPAVMRSTKLVPLDYSRDGQTWLRVFGRPADYAGPNLDDLTQAGAGSIDLQFEQLDVWHYSIDHDSVTLSVAPGASGGLLTPLVAPLRVGREGGVRDRYAFNAGDGESPVTIRFDGPARDPEVTLTGGWRFAVKGSLAWDEYLIIDGGARTAYVYSTTRDNRRAAFSMIRNGSRFSDLRIPPGQHSLQFRAIDDTYMAEVTVSWPHTYLTMQ